MTKEFTGQDSHISIEMPNGETCRAFFPFQVYSTDDGGEIIRFTWREVNRLIEAIEAHLKQNEVRSIEVSHLPALIERQTLTNLPHSPARTQMRSID